MIASWLWSDQILSESCQLGVCASEDDIDSDSSDDDDYDNDKDNGYGNDDHYDIYTLANDANTQCSP